MKRTNVVLSFLLALVMNFGQIVPNVMPTQQHIAEAAGISVQATIEQMDAEVLQGGGCCNSVVLEEDIVDYNPVNNLAYLYHRTVFENGDVNYRQISRAIKRIGSGYEQQLSYARGEIVALGPTSIAYPLGGGLVGDNLIFRATKPGSVIDAMGTIINPDRGDVDWVRFRTDADVLNPPDGRTCSQTCNQQNTCMDRIDNNGNYLVDAADPFCHSDGNPYNPSSYMPWAEEGSCYNNGCDACRYTTCPNPPAPAPSYGGRQETGKGGSLRFGVGVRVVGFIIRYDNGVVCGGPGTNGGWIDSTTMGGTVTDGVIWPSPGEYTDYRLRRCY